MNTPKITQTKRETGKVKSPEWLKTLLAVLVGGLITFGSNYFVQKMIFQQEAKQSAREKREEVYFDFMKYANEYDAAVSESKECLGNFDKYINSDGLLNERCTKIVNDLQAARFNFNRSKTQVFVYGSDEAVSRRDAIGRVLPDSRGEVTIKNTGWPQFTEVLKYDTRAFSAPYLDFMSVACRELPSSPRNNCDAR